ncbi:hypothetical protein [Streptomyces salinarius]|uniref:Uncharacterized protein n=1 Tax=Streptomyces salinarius TaxID=2762598 RepID=A0ABW8BHD6_9ACTN
MKSPAELDAVPWQSLRHAYGPAEDVPELIRALYQDDETAAAEAMHELYGNIHHQGTVYPASPPPSLSSSMPPGTYPAAASSC